VPKFTPISSKKLINYLISLGFKVSRQKGSHKFFRHNDNRTTVVPFHQGEDLGIGITLKILKDIEQTKEDLNNWIQGK